MALARQGGHNSSNAFDPKQNRSGIKPKRSEDAKGGERKKPVHSSGNSQNPKRAK